MKTLYIIIGDAGDGSNFLRYTFSQSALNYLVEKDADGELDERYQSGDGLQVRSLTVPDECTYETLGIHTFQTLEDEVQA